MYNDIVFQEGKAFREEKKKMKLSIEGGEGNRVDASERQKWIIMRRGRKEERIDYAP